MGMTGAEVFGTWIIKGFTGVLDKEPSYRSAPCYSREELDETILATETLTAPQGPLKAFELEKIA